MKIYAYAICKNESKHVLRWLNSVKEADGIYVLDTGSTDDTVQLLQRGGAAVTSKIISPWRFDTARNAAMDLIPDDADICVSSDLDEVFHPGWRTALESQWTPDTCQARYRYTWNFNSDGTEGYVFYREQIHSRHGFRWVNPVHEILEYNGNRNSYKCITAHGIQLDHHADESKSRAQYLPLLEAAVAENPQNDRNIHYLGREYMFYRRWDDCISTLMKHLSLPSATWRDERAASMRYIARSYAEKGDSSASLSWHLRACGESPYLREPWIDLAKYYYAAGNWYGVIFACRQAVNITHRPESYISESESWGSFPWDILSIAYYYTENYSLALSAAEKALDLSPNDERIRKNVEFFRSSLLPAS